MWNRDKYNLMLTEIAKKKDFRGRYVKNKEALYLLLKEELHVSYSTVKGWGRPTSKGPGDQSVLEKLEGLLETKLTFIEVEQEDNIMKVEKCSDFVKNNIKDCYNLMIDFLHSDECENEEVYCKMREELRKYRIAVPKDLFAKIEECVDTYLDPIIYDHNNFFAELYTEDMGCFDEDSIFHLKDETSTLKHLGLYLDKMIKVEKAIESFAMKELYPILVN